MELTRLVLAWALVWLTGAAIVRRVYALSGAETPPHPAWRAGIAYFAGAFLLPLIMSALSRIGIPFGALSIGASLLALAVALRLPDARRLRAVGALRVPSRPTAPWSAARIAWYVLLAWLALRFALLLGEVMRQPLFPWDAWTQWATKARVWFELRHMAPFVRADQWLQGVVPGAYFDAAPHYPATVPLWQVWSSIAMGRWDDATMNLPWWLAGVALALVLYGFLRGESLSPLFSLAATWLIVSMPILEAHVALAGYADLPLACYLTAGALAGWRALTRRTRADGVVALLLLAAVPMIKIPGWVWIATLVPGVIVALLPRIGLRVVVIGWVCAIGLAFVLGRFEPVIMGYHLHFQLDVPWRGLGEAYFSFDNWHLLFWILPAVMLAARRQITTREIAPLTVVVGSGTLFLVLGFSITSASVWVEDQSTVNRATLHLAPLLATWLVLLVHRALVADAAEPAAAPAGVPAPSLASADSVDA
jgi:hypothetical protein